MISFSTDNNGFTAIQFDTAFSVTSDWFTVSEGTFSFADTLTVNIGNDSVTITGTHTLLSNRIGLFGADPVEQGVAPTGTVGEKIDGLIAYFVSRGDLRTG